MKKSAIVRWFAQRWSVCVVMVSLFFPSYGVTPTIGMLRFKELDASTEYSEVEKAYISGYAMIGLFKILPLLRQKVSIAASINGVNLSGLLSLPPELVAQNVAAHAEHVAQLVHNISSVERQKHLSERALQFLNSSEVNDVVHGAFQPVRVRIPLCLVLTVPWTLKGT
jgi:hypothetical protein